jgi:hypothetical protein
MFIGFLRFCGGGKRRRRQLHSLVRSQLKHGTLGGPCDVERTVGRGILLQDSLLARNRVPSW